MYKTVKFGGSSLADAAQFQKVKEIILSDSDRRYVVVSAPGKRYKGDEKITDMLYQCQALAQSGAPFDNLFGRITRRYVQIRDTLGLPTDSNPSFRTSITIWSAEQALITLQAAENI